MDGETARKALYCPKCDGNVMAAASRCHRCDLARPARGWPADEHVGSVVADKYRIIDRIGRGGMGSVYVAEQVYEGASLGKVALKFLQPRGTAREQEFIRKKFVSEAGFARLFNSPHVIKVYDFGTYRGETFMAMEFLQGESLDDRLLRDENLRTPAVVDIARQIAEALVEVHRHDVVHRDIKPDNILLMKVDGRDFVKILDFGIAKRIDPMDGRSSTRIGTPVYMPPEQLGGRSIDARADLYSLGVLMYEALSGETPVSYESLSDEEALGALETRVHDIGAVRPGLPEELRRLVNSMVHPRPERRPRSAQAVVDSLRELEQKMAKDDEAPAAEDDMESRGEALHRQLYGTLPPAGQPGPTRPRTPRPVDFASHGSAPTRRGRVVRVLAVLAAILGLLAVLDMVYINVFMDDPGVPARVVPASTAGAPAAADDDALTEDATSEADSAP